MPVESLLSAINQVLRAEESEHLESFSSTLFTLLYTIPYLLYAVRKHLLDCIRIQSSQHTNIALHTTYQKLNLYHALCSSTPSSR